MYFCTQFIARYVAYFLGKETLYCWYVQQYDCGYVKTRYGPYNPSYNCSKFLQLRLQNYKKTILYWNYYI